MSNLQQLNKVYIKKIVPTLFVKRFTWNGAKHISEFI